jgi:hypothetical protein
MSLRWQWRSKRREIERRMVKFHGVHEAGRTYEANALVVKRGSLWISVTKTTLPPGSTDWQLKPRAGEARDG